MPLVQVLQPLVLKESAVARGAPIPYGQAAGHNRHGDGQKQDRLNICTGASMQISQLGTDSTGDSNTLPGFIQHH